MSQPLIRTDRGPDVPQAVATLTGGEVDAYPSDLADQHKRLIRWFEESETARIEEIELAERDRAYYDHDQWTPEELKVLQERGQPAIIIPKIHDKVELLCGMERKARTDPKAFPRTPTEEDRADAATQALRYIGQTNKFDLVRSGVFNNLLVEGAGGGELFLEDNGKGGVRIGIRWVPWDRIWYDPHSRGYDFADARYHGLVIWMDTDQGAEMYPGREGAIEASFSPGDFNYNDRPDYVSWTDPHRKRIRIIQPHWVERGTWWTATCSKGGFLAEPQKSPFKNHEGKSTASLQLQSAYINKRNQRYGMVRGLIGLQDEINKRRSKALHLLSVRQVVADIGAVEDVDEARRQVARPDGYVEKNPGLEFEIQEGGDLAAGQFQLLQHATAEMQLTGPNAAMSGTDSRELSGRAILTQQAGGAVQNEPLADSLRFWSRRIYEIAWQAAREYWKGGQWVRVTDELNETRWVGINQQITVADKLAELPEDRRAAVMQQMQLQPNDPRLQQVIGTRNDITDLDVDIEIGEGTQTPTQQAEEFQALVQIASLQPGLIPGDVLIAASSLKDKDALLERMKEHQQQQAQQGQAVADVQHRTAEADINVKNAKAAADKALAVERVHGVHADFSAAPYGQPNVDDAPTVQAAPEAPPPFEAEHAAADLIQKHADWRHTQAQTALTQAKVPQTLHATHNTMLQTQRLAKTPIPKPGQTQSK